MKLATRLLLIGLITVATLLLPMPAELSWEGHRALVALVFTAALLALRPVSLPIIGLIIPVSQIALGIANVNHVFATFSRPVIFLILGSLFLAEALRKHGLIRRVTLRLILAAHGNVKWILLAIMTIAAMFSMWVENTATAAMLIPVAITLTANVVDKRRGERLRALFVLGVAYGSSLGGMITVIGSASNAVAFSFIQEVQKMTFLDWIRVGLPAFCVIFPVTWLMLLKLFPVSSSKLNLEIVDREYEKLGSLRPPERDTIGTLCTAIFFWMFGSWFENVLGLPPTVLSPTVIAIAAVSFLTIRQVINWEDVKGVSWGFLFIIGAGLSLGETLVRTGLTTWLIQLLGPLLSSPTSWLTITLLCYISAFLTNLINNATVVAIFIPIVLNLSRSIPSTPGLPLAFAIALATTFGYSLPSASGRMAIISASNLISDREMLKCGLRVTLISTLLLAVFIYVAGIVQWI